MDHAQAQTVEGNVLVLGVPNEVFRDKLMATDKREALEKALYTILKVPLSVRVVLAETNAGKMAVDTDDPVIARGLELGGEVSPYSNEDKPDW
jgi:hypothetical protein